MSWIKDKLLSLLAYVLPTPVDFDWLGVLGITRLPIIGRLPVKKIDFGALSWPKRILTLLLLLIPYFDLEMFTFFGLDHKLGLYSKGSSTSASKSRSMSSSQQPSTGGHSLGGLLKILLVVIVLGGIFTTGYGTLASNAVGNQVIGLDLEDEVLAAQQALQQIRCIGGSAACMEKWMYNNTRRPESEVEGREFKLEIEEFTVNGGDPVDIAGKRPSYIIPASFSVYNPRHGLKGITARDAQYRVKIQKPEGVAGLRGAETLCSTGWKPLNGQYAESYGGDTGTIHPGGFATPLGTLSDLNISSCGLMQPDIGITRHVELDVRYNYSSQAQISFEAMAADNIEGRPSFAESETADTPVKTFVNVQDPATYRTTSEGRTPKPFLLKVGFETAQRNIEYKVNPEDLVIHDSSATLDVDSAREETDLDIPAGSNCLGLKKTGEDTYKLSERQQGRMGGTWYDTGDGPSAAICAMVLQNPDSISPSGETLRMSVDANYTVRLSESVTNFKAQNRDCDAGGRINCPLIVPEDKKEEYEVETEHLISKCDDRVRIQAQDGCSVRKGGIAGDRTWETVELWNNESVDAEIEEGETAYTWNYIHNLFQTQFLDNEPEVTDTAIGLSDGEFESLENAKGGNAVGAALVIHENFGDNDVEVREIEPTLCKGGFDTDYSANMEDFRKYWNLDNPDVDTTLLFEGKSRNDCSKDQGWWDDVMDDVFGGQSPKEAFKEEVDDCTTESGELSGVVVIEDSSFQCFDG